MFNKNSKIFLAGHKGLVGSALLRLLQKENYKNIVVKNRTELNLLNTEKVFAFFDKEKPEIVFLAAAKVGGIFANMQYPADFIYQNLQIQNNIIHAAYKYNVKKLLFLGSSCIYPKYSQQPIKEHYLLSSNLEESNKAYAIAKISGLISCQAYKEQYNCNFISVMPTNLYGPNDNYDKNNSHVIAALIRKFHFAKIKKEQHVIVWGSGNARREFMFVDDCVRAIIFIMHKYNEPDPINIGVGKDITIKELACIIKDIVNFQGDIIFDCEKPDGTPRKLLDISKLIALDFNTKSYISLKKGLLMTYKHFMKNLKNEL